MLVQIPALRCKGVLEALKIVKEVIMFTHLVVPKYFDIRMKFATTYVPVILKYF